MLELPSRDQVAAKSVTLNFNLLALGEAKFYLFFSDVCIKWSIFSWLEIKTVAKAREKYRIIFPQNSSEFIDIKDKV